MFFKKGFLIVLFYFFSFYLFSFLFLSSSSLVFAITTWVDGSVGKCIFITNFQEIHDKGVKMNYYIIKEAKKGTDGI